MKVLLKKKKKAKAPLSTQKVYTGITKATYNKKENPTTLKAQTLKPKTNGRPQPYTM
jgi:hypothetical protein